MSCKKKYLQIYQIARTCPVRRPLEVIPHDFLQDIDLEPDWVSIIYFKSHSFVELDLWLGSLFCWKVNVKYTFSWQRLVSFVLKYIDIGSYLFNQNRVSNCAVVNITITSACASMYNLHIHREQWQTCMNFPDRYTLSRMTGIPWRAFCLNLFRWKGMAVKQEPPEAASS